MWIRSTSGWALQSGEDAAHVGVAPLPAAQGLANQCQACVDEASALARQSRRTW